MPLTGSGATTRPVVVGDDRKAPGQPVVRRRAVQVALEHLDVRFGEPRRDAFLPVAQVGHGVVVLVEQVLLEQRHALGEQVEVPLGEHRVQWVERVHEGVEDQPVADEVVGQADLVLQDDDQLRALVVHGVEEPPEMGVVDDVPAVGDEVRPHVEVVDVVLLEPLEELCPDSRHRDRLGERVGRCVGGRGQALRRLHAPPGAVASIHLAEDLGEPAQQVAAVVDQEQLVVLPDDVPGDQLARQHGVGTEVVGGVANGPGALGDALELVQLAVLQMAVAEVVDVGEASQLADVLDDVVVDDPVHVVAREEAHASRRPLDPATLDRALARMTGGAHPPGRAPEQQVVHVGVERLATRVQMVRPVPPHVEVRRRAGQQTPSQAAEVGQRVGPGRQGIRHLGEVERLVEVAGGPDQLDLPSQLRIRQVRGVPSARPGGPRRAGRRPGPGARRGRGSGRCPAARSAAGSGPPGQRWVAPRPAGGTSRCPTSATRPGNVASDRCDRPPTDGRAGPRSCGRAGGAPTLLLEVVHEGVGAGGRHVRVLAQISGRAELRARDRGRQRRRVAGSAAPGEDRSPPPRGTGAGTTVPGRGRRRAARRPGATPRGSPCVASRSTGGGRLRRLVPPLG